MVHGWDEGRDDVRGRMGWMEGNREKEGLREAYRGREEGKMGGRNERKQGKRITRAAQWRLFSLIASLHF